MEFKTIDFLIEQINEIIQKPSAESLRANTMVNVRHVFSKLGYHLVCAPYNFEIAVVSGKWTIPSEIVEILDVGTSEFNFNGTALKPGYIPGAGLNFHKTTMELIFPGVPFGKFYGMGWSFYKDEQGYLIIPEEAYTACYDYCAWRSLVSSNNPKLPLWGDRFAMADQSRISMAEARGMLNKMDNTTYRSIRKLS